MKKILFLIHDLGVGGAEKVLVNLVNNMDHLKFDITVLSLFGGGVNEQFLSPHIHYRAIFQKTIPGNSILMKFLSPKQLHNLFVKEHYDIEVAYLEGPSTRIISGCPYKDTSLVSWVHCTMKSKSDCAIGFRNYAEALECYSAFDQIVSVSEDVKRAFQKICPVSSPNTVLYNTNLSDEILQKAEESITDAVFDKNSYNIIGAGKIVAVKGFDRLSRVHKRLRQEGYEVHTFVLGIGSQKKEIEEFLEDNGLIDSFTFLGYKTNPYKYIAQCDVFVCSSYSEGFSTATTESLIVGVPVCTTDVSGMKEMMGEKNEYGIVTENTEDALYEGIKRLLDDRNLLVHYKRQAEIRGQKPQIFVLSMW